VRDPGGADQAMKAEECLATFEGRELDRDMRGYLRYHCERYAVLLEAARRFVHPGPGLRILDIGMSFQTELLRRAYPEATVNTMGFHDGRFADDAGRHWDFDLNDAFYPDKWVGTDRHHLVVMAEVIEHLYTSPRQVLRYLRTTTLDSGYLLIQTPNAASLMKRRLLLAGHNPYEMIRETRVNPGHFREYTRYELESVARQAGFEPVETLMLNYFRYSDRNGRIYKAICDRFPPGFRDGITMALRAVPEPPGHEENARK
jgi:hypothetical protein